MDIGRFKIHLRRVGKFCPLFFFLEGMQCVEEKFKRERLGV